MSDDLKGLETWNDAMTSLQLLQIDSHGLGGIWLRAPFGPVRDSWLRHLAQTGLNTVKLPGHIDAERLLGGIDLSRTLQSGRLHWQSGLLQQADQGVVCISMAENFPSALVAPITQAMDTQSVGSAHTQFGAVALDESLDDEPSLNPALQERLGLWFDLKDIAPSDISVVSLNTPQQDISADALSIRIASDALAQMRASLALVNWTDEQALAICSTAQDLGIDSLRIPTLALRVARCHAVLYARSQVADDDLAFAARRVLGPRVTRLPSPEEDAPQPEADQRPSDDQAANTPEHPTPTEMSRDNEDEPPTKESPDDQRPDEEDAANTPSPENLQEMMIAAALASLPSDVLDRLLTKPGRNQSNTSGTSGQFRTGMQRGRPLPPRPGRPGGQARLHVLATLRAAAPKQRLRQGAQEGRVGRVAIRSEDFHVHRYQQHSSSCLILALDASGSAALQRLAEAKGAVELLLQQSYARRDSVCIVSFKGAQAQLLLPMTRSLVRAKRAMTGLPGGGGTPLALALKMACEQATQLQRQGVTPILVVLSDGRANVNLQGVGGRAQAQVDAQQWAAQWRQTGHRALWIDTSLQPDAQVQHMANIMGGSYMPMPQVQAQRMATAMENLRRSGA